MNGARDGSGFTRSARRQWERRQRSWWRDKLLSVRFALSAAQHHSAQRAGPGTHEAPRGQTTVCMLDSLRTP